MDSIDNKKIVLYIGGFELPDKNAAAQRVIANGKIMRSLGYQVIFIGVSKSRNEFGNKTLLEDEYDGFRYYSICYPKTLLEWIKFLSSIKYVQNLKHLNVSHIIAYNYPAIALWRLKRYCSARKIKLIGDCTEWYEAEGNILFKVIKSLDVSLRMKYLHTRLDGLIVISDFLEDYYSNNKKPLINVPPLVDTSMEKWKHINGNVNEGPIRLVYAGSPGTGKKDRLDKVINFLSIIKANDIDFKFVVIGISAKEYISLFSTKIPINIKENIFFLGRLSHTAVLSEIGKSHFQIFLRDRNLTNLAGFPTKFVEAISCGTPVLSNNSGNLSKYLISGKTGFLLDNKTDDQAIDSLEKAMKVNRSVIIYMKEFCHQSNPFNYPKYSEPFCVFLHKVNQGY